MSCLALEEISGRTVLDATLVSRSPLIQRIYELLLESHFNFIEYNYNSIYTLLTDQVQIDQYRMFQSRQCISLLDLIQFLPILKSSERFLKQQENVLIFCFIFYRTNI